jgi:uncharacterized protein
MAEIEPEILELIKKYIGLLNENGFQIKKAYLYGSYVNGNQNEWSDIDIAIISDKFEGNRFFDKEKIRGLYRMIDNRISVLPLNEESLDSFFIQKEVIEKGIRIS